MQVTSVTLASASMVGLACWARTTPPSTASALKASQASSAMRPRKVPALGCGLHSTPGSPACLLPSPAAARGPLHLPRHHQHRPGNSPCWLESWVLPSLELIRLHMTLLGARLAQGPSGRWGRGRGRGLSLHRGSFWAPAAACACPQLLPDALPVFPASSPLGPCIPNPCYNDGECQVIKDTYRGDIFTQYFCKCPHGYTGIHCETSEYLGMRALPGSS